MEDMRGAAEYEMDKWADNLGKTMPLTNLVTTKPAEPWAEPRKADA